MDDLTQIYIDKLAEANHTSVMLEVENRSLKRKIEELENKLGKDKETDKEADNKDKSIKIKRG